MVEKVMQKRRLFRRFFLICVSILYWLAFATSLSLAASLKADAVWIVTNMLWFSGFYKVLIGTSPVLLPVSALIIPITSLIRNKAVNPRVESAIKKILDDFRERAFPETDPHITHRVTLFRYHYWHWRLLTKRHIPWGGCLVPFERAGEFKLSSGSCFLASKGKPDISEGVVGKVFTTRLCEYISGLPKLESKCKINDGSINKYAKQTLIDPKWVKEKAVKNYKFSRSFWGVPVDVDGEIWGVFLIDSRSPNLEGSENLKDLYRPYGSCISKLLSKR